MACLTPLPNTASSIRLRRADFPQWTHPTETRGPRSFGDRAMRSSPGCPPVSNCRTVSTRPLLESGLCEPRRVALSLIDKSDDYQCQSLLDLDAIVHAFRDELANHIERSAHRGDGLRAVGPVKQGFVGWPTDHDFVL